MILIRYLWFNILVNVAVFPEVRWKITRVISMGQCKKDVTPLLVHWSYIFLALTHRYLIQSNPSNLYLCSFEMVQFPWAVLKSTVTQSRLIIFQSLLTVLCTLHSTHCQSLLLCKETAKQSMFQTVLCQPADRQAVFQGASISIGWFKPLLWAEFKC